MESLTWISHPARERPFTAILVTVFIILVMTIVYFFMDHSLFMMIIAGMIFTISLSAFYFPTTYSVDEKKVSIKYRFSIKERNLSAFRQYYPETRGILLSPFLSPSRLENFRGFYLRYGKDNKAEVDAMVKKLIDMQNANADANRDEVKPDVA
jgi:hypothetical protein